MHLNFRSFLPVVFSLHLLFTLSTGLAQTLSRLTGTVTDSSGSAIAGAKLTAVDVSTGVSYETTSSGTGTYTFPLLRNGTYKITGEFIGFKTFEQLGIVIEGGASRTVDIEMRVGEVAETVTVSGGTPLLESENSEVGQVLEHSTMLQTPVASRRAAMLVRLTGAVSMGQELGGNKLPMFSMAGGRSRMQMWTLDGTSLQAVGTIVSQIFFNPPSEAVEEFRIIMNHYPADVGRTLGGAIQMTTRSGTNEFHGSLYEFLRNEKLDARTFFARGKDPFRFNIFGGSLGGPILKKRTFFFANMELNRQRIGRTYVHDEVPHPLDRLGDFSRRRDVTIRDPLTGQPFPNNIIPANRIDPVARELVKFYPLPNSPTNDITRAPVDNFVGFGTDVQDQEFPTVRIDHTQGQRDKFFFRWSRNNVRIKEPGSYTGDLLVADPVARGPNKIDFRNSAVGWIHNITPMLFNDFKFMYRTGINDERNVGAGSGVNSRVGLRGVDPNNFARMTLTGLSSIGSTALSGFFDRDTIEFIENVAWVRGSHNLKFGLNWRNGGRFDDLTESANLNFNNRATNDALAAFLLGWTTSSTVNKSAINTRNTYWAGYVQDDWKVTPKFTLNLGLRWDMDSPPYRKPREIGSGFDRTKINPVSGTPGVVTFLPFAETGFQPFRSDKNNFGPRFGFAYRMFERTVIRGGYSIMYSMPWGGAGSGWEAGFFPASTINSADGGFTPAFLLASGVPPSPPAEKLDDSFGAVPVGGSARFAVSYWDPNHRTPYSQSFNFGIQRQLSQELVAEITYLGNLVHKITNNLSYNMIPLVNGRGPAAQDQRLRPFPQFSNVTQLSAPIGNSTYHALNAKLERRYSSGLSYMMHYTWSKFIDDTPGSEAVGSAGPLQHIELLKLDKALSDNHQAHRYVASSVFDLPLGKGKRFNIANPVMNQVIGNWSLSGIAELRSGSTIGVIEAVNRTNTFSTGQRPNLIRDPIIRQDRSRGETLIQWFDTSAFVDPGVGGFGTAPRTICCAPGYMGIDLSVQKQFPFSERWKLAFRTDFLNVPNRPNFAPPSNRRGVADFGRVTSILSGSTGRQIQFALRLEF